jgi:bifunctional DNase/RNase
MKKQKKKHKKHLLVILAVILLIFILLILPELFITTTIPELSTLGYVKMEPSIAIVNETGVLRFRSNCKEVSMIISPDQALSIEKGINKKVEFRPNAHDLIVQIFDTYGFKVMMVKIVDLKKNTYYAKLFVRKGNKILSLDARPSDATAIAVRVDAPIYVKKKLARDVC